jgi:cardiolipin synthase
LLEGGIQIFEYQPTMMHCKVLVIDGVWSSVGSANFDDRSFRLNDEANLNVFSEELAREQIRLIDDDIQHRAHGAEEVARPDTWRSASTSAWRCSSLAALMGTFLDS